MGKNFDLVIRNATIYDGSGGPWYFGDIAVKDGLIAGIGKIDTLSAKTSLDAEGRALAPGFVDPHTHSDLCTPVPSCDGKIVQGVTTEITGNCGLSLSPVAPERLDLLRDYLKPFLSKQAMPSFEWTRGDLMDMVDRDRYATDLAFLVGHGTVRIAVMGFEDRVPRRAEMKILLAHEMEDGCIRFLNGPHLPSGCFTECGNSGVLQSCGPVRRYLCNTYAERIVEYSSPSGGHRYGGTGRV